MSKRPAPERSRTWLTYALVTVGFWGVWGAFTDLPAAHGFPETLIYCVWALTMIVPAYLALRQAGWRLQRDARAIVYGSLIGLLGAGGQMLLFHAVRTGPGYLIFPVISLSPLITVVMSSVLLGERTGKSGALGILLALASLPLFDYAGGSMAGSWGQPWFLCALGVLLAWGVQSFLMKLANASMSAESIFFYMTVSAVALIPIALGMTDLSKPVNWGLKGAIAAAVIQILNSIGALSLVHAFRGGKAIVVAPLANAGAPLLTALLSILLLGTVPTPFKVVGIALALIAAVLLSIEPEPVKAEAST